MASMRLEIIQPDDWHVHLRDDEFLKETVTSTARCFYRAIVMPNLKKPITKTAEAAAYRDRILSNVPKGRDFLPLMTCYLTDNTDADDLIKGFRSGVFCAAKLYPAKATTNSEFGVTHLSKLNSVFEAMQAANMPLLIHGESTLPHVDVFDREFVFIEQEYKPLLTKFPKLRSVFEHITTKEAVEFVRSQKGRVAATITAHHLLINRSDLFRSGIRPHLYCLPIAKREEHRLALRKAVTSGEECFFLGTDSAPHPVQDKESACGCAGIYSAPNAIELYAQVFEEEGRLEKLEAFASIHGPQFYGMNISKQKISLEKQSWPMVEKIEYTKGKFIIPFKAGEDITWKIIN